ncbi:hypothetical protein E4U53_004584 [Claviceps sorghi]|nr:hypothetical protein E4U53_004584 [Claviceps sorghi]
MRFSQILLLPLAALAMAAPATEAVESTELEVVYATPAGIQTTEGAENVAFGIPKSCRGEVAKACVFSIGRATKDCGIAIAEEGRNLGKDIKCFFSARHLIKNFGNCKKCNPFKVVLLE